MDNDRSADSKTDKNDIHEQIDAMLSTQKTQPHKRNNFALIVSVIILLLVVGLSAALLTVNSGSDGVSTDTSQSN